VRKAVTAIERNARAQAQLISELLDVSRIIAGKLHLEFEVVDIKAVVLSAVEACKLTVRKGIDIRANFSDDKLGEGDACVLGDATRLQQVVTNLLENAVKFTEGDGTIEIRVEQADRHIALTVTDTGSGIPAHQLDNIFHSFSQSLGSRRKGGLGLGLSISKQLVEAHGGQIRVASPGPGLGATFTVDLPRVNGPVPSAKEVHSIESRLNDRSILVIDDDADLLELMRHALEHRGARVDTVQTAAAALSKLRDQSYDVLVSDLGLPDQDGLALMQEARARGHLGPSLRAVALTGYASEADARLCKAAGFELHLVKPIGPWEVARAITRLLEGPSP
jgi:CheY-like chemotaxis protein